MEKRICSSFWKQMKEEGFASMLAKLLFLILIYGLILVMILENEGGWRLTRGAARERKRIGIPF